jgi:hypothetical protein
MTVGRAVQFGAPFALGLAVAAVGMAWVAIGAFPHDVGTGLACLFWPGSAISYANQNGLSIPKWIIILGILFGGIGGAVSAFVPKQPESYIDIRPREANPPAPPRHVWRGPPVPPTSQAEPRQ